MSDWYPSPKCPNCNNILKHAYAHFFKCKNCNDNMIYGWHKGKIFVSFQDLKISCLILCAGIGTRIKEVTNKPKGFLQVDGKKTILDKQIFALNQYNINDITLVVDNKFDKSILNNVSYVVDDNQNHDVLNSLMIGMKIYPNKELLILYSDIIFEDSILQKMIDCNADIGLGIDEDWEKSYEGRTDHPIQQADNVIITNHSITSIRKNIPKAHGEFIGMMRLSKKGTHIFVDVHNDLLQKQKNTFHCAKSLEKAYLTDMIQELIDRGYQVYPVTIFGAWHEFDTKQDYARYLHPKYSQIEMVNK